MAQFEKSTFAKRLKTMLKVDFRRMFTMPLVYIMIGCCLVAPILILVMTTMMDGSVTVDPQTGVETVIEGFDSAWEIIGSIPGGNAAAGMSMTAMCNINLIYFAVAVLVCLFIGADFRSGYVKNLFTVRAKKSDFVISKTLVGFVCGALMMLAFFVGSLLGGAIAGLPFDLGTATMGNVVMCMLAKIALVAVFVAIAVVWSVIGKQKLWLSLVGACCVGMLLFMMIPMLTPLNATMMNVLLCLAGGVLFAAGLGVASRAVLKARDIL